MSILYISWKNIVHKRLASLLSVLLLAISIALISFLYNFNEQVNRHFLKNIRGIDLIVSAKGSPLQAMLSSVYFVDAPTGNINYKVYEELQKHPLVKQIIPLAYGDNFAGFSIVGTDENYYKLFNAELAKGNLASKPFEVVIGHRVAKTLNLKVGDDFHSAHGRHESGEKHTDTKFVVVGLLEKADAVIDNLILCQVEDVWNIHHISDAESQELTSLLIELRNPMGMIVLANLLRTDESVQLVVPSVEIDRLFKLFGFGRVALDALAYLILFLAVISIFISMLNNMQYRKYEVALMRTMGAGQLKVFKLVMFEVLILAAIGFIVGMILSRIGLLAMSTVMEKNYQMSISASEFPLTDLLLIPITIVICIVAALLPAIKALKTDIAKVLADEF
ncbi:MAG: FtsX-like permease family protein [Bacteroidia bacterium]|nr:FtsX-like permease family protein [Bacteroidia bacterium]